MVEKDNFPTDNLAEVVGYEFVVIWFDKLKRLFIFSLSYQGPEKYVDQSFSR